MKNKKQNLLAKIPANFAAKSVAAAVSGGADSVAMLLLLNDFCRIKKIRLCVFHVDHAIRSESENDRKWVAGLAERLGLSFFWRRASVKGEGSESGKRSEAWARDFRYKCFAEMLEETGFEAVATGHTLDDQAETIVMRMIRGASLQGLGGIRINRIRNVQGRKIRIFRPLLKISRASLIELLNGYKQSWLEDETNAGDDYFRNRIRHHLMPVMEQMGSSFKLHLAESAIDIARMQNYLSHHAAVFLQKAGKDGTLDLAKKPPKILRLEILRLWLIEKGLADKISRALIERIDDLWVKNSGGRTVNHRCFQITRNKKKLLLVKQ